MPTEIRFMTDGQLESDINHIMETFKRKGFRNISKPDVVRLLVQDYKRRAEMARLTRKPKSREFTLL